MIRYNEGERNRDKLSATLENLMQTVAVLKAENDKLKKCVEFYADKMNWYDNTGINGSEQNAIFKDSEDCLIKSIDKHIVIGGKRARQTLKHLLENVN